MDNAYEVLTPSISEFFIQLRAEVEIESHNIFYRPENKATNQHLLATHEPLSSMIEKLVNNIELYVNELQSPSDQLFIRSAFAPAAHSPILLHRAQLFSSFLNSQPAWPSVPYDEAVNNLMFIKEVEQRKISYETTIANYKLKLAEEEKEKARLAIELSLTKDALASKQSQLTSILTELASSRQQYENLVRSIIHKL